MRKHTLLTLIALALIQTSGAAAQFMAALPVWPEGRSTELNVFAEFRAAFVQTEPGSALLRLTGATQYRIYVNGEFAGFGPARAGHGFYRVDEIELSRWLHRGNNAVV